MTEDLQMNSESIANSPPLIPRPFLGSLCGYLEISPKIVGREF